MEKQVRTMKEFDQSVRAWGAKRKQHLAEQKERDAAAMQAWRERTNTGQIVTAAAPRKSVATAAVLGFLFGPFGMFYVSAGWGLLSLFITFFVVMFLGPLAWIMWALIAAVMVDSQNKAPQRVSIGS